MSIVGEVERLKKIYNIGKEIQVSDLLALVKSARYRRFNRGEVIVPESSTTKDIFLIRKGLVRAFGYNKRGEDITFGFRYEHQVIGNFDSIFLNQPSRLIYECFESATTLSLDYQVIMDRIISNPRLMVVYQHVMEHNLKIIMKRLETFILLSPEERYLDFMEDYKSIIGRLPEKFIANYLGITPVSLSRIRARLVEKNTR